jgi:hypothetical protein
MQSLAGAAGPAGGEKLDEIRALSEVLPREFSISCLPSAGRSPTPWLCEAESAIPAVMILGPLMIPPSIAFLKSISM